MKQKTKRKNLRQKKYGLKLRVKYKNRKDREQKKKAHNAEKNAYREKRANMKTNKRIIFFTMKLAKSRRPAVSQAIYSGTWI